MMKKLTKNKPLMIIGLLLVLGVAASLVLGNSNEADKEKAPQKENSTTAESEGSEGSETSAEPETDGGGDSATLEQTDAQQTTPDNDDQSTSSTDSTPGATSPLLVIAEQTATYTIKYEVVWSSESHPQTLPANAHVSPIVVVAHKTKNDLFTSGKLATEGIEIMAETGATTILMKEINANSAIQETVIGTVINAPGSNELKIEVDQDHSLLSAVSMLAPSPDWFVAASNLELFKNGQWVDEIQYEMRAYDAGSDSGATFTANNSDSNPAEAIGPPRDASFKKAADEGSFAKITIKRQ